MYFLAVIGPDVGPLIAPAGLSRIFASGNITVYGTSDITVTPFADLLVIGTSYPSPNPQPVRDGATPFERLSTERWGPYLAIRVDQADQEPVSLDIFADPSALLPCYYVVRGSRICVGSDARTLLRAASLPIEIDWDEVALQLLQRDRRGTSCSLKYLRDVPAGAVTQLRGARANTTSIWTPARHLRQTRLLSFHEAVRHTRAVIEYCVDHLATGHLRVLAGISGGLDSSIVAACLARSGADFECFTMYDDGGDADERPYGRLLADHLGVRLTECPYRIDDVDLNVSSVAALPRPIGWPFQQSLDQASRALLHRIDADVIVRGTGGDAIFCYNNSAAPIVDALFDHGPIAAARTCVDVSTLTGASLWQCLAAARMSFGRRRRPVTQSDGSFLSADVLDRADMSWRHFWLEDCKDMPPGRQRQVAMLSAAHNALEARYAVGPTIMCPLLSQPVMEVAISVPAAEWIRGGTNRAVARAAFADMLPQAILDRTSKGGPGSFATMVYREKRLEICDRLIGGRLAAHGIVDAAAVHRVTSRHSVDSPKQLVRLLALADAEAWVHHWIESGAA